MVNDLELMDNIVKKSKLTIKEAAKISKIIKKGANRRFLNEN